VNISFVGASAFLKEVGRYGENVICAQVVPSYDERGLLIAEEYRTAMKLSNDSNLDFTSFEGFLIAKLLTEAIKASGKNLTRETLISALESGRVDLHGFALEMSETSHKGSSQVWLTQIRGGRIQKLEINSLLASLEAS
jgi:branched-chain amino acid transport system substrate-binding protein